MVKFIKLFFKIFIISFIIVYGLSLCSMTSQNKKGEGDSYYVLSRSDRLSSDHRMYKQGYKYSCVFRDTDPNAKIKYMDFYYTGTCPEYRNK